MWDLIVSVPDNCLSFYFDCFEVLKLKCICIGRYVYCKMV